MHIVYRAASIIDANLVKMALESVGVMAIRQWCLPDRGGR